MLAGLVSCPVCSFEQNPAFEISMSKIAQTGHKTMAGQASGLGAVRTYFPELQHARHVGRVPLVAQEKSELSRTRIPHARTVHRAHADMHRPRTNQRT